jgi:hypothetical protein
LGSVYIPPVPTGFGQGDEAVSAEGFLQRSVDAGRHAFQRAANVDRGAAVDPVTDLIGLFGNHGLDVAAVAGVA